jgi:mono/diheme cytochrome c family protein
MNYPVWDVPYLGSGLVIAIIAIFHVMISHFAVGGGLYLPMAEAKALREGREDWMRTVKAHSKFFLILTGVFGAVSGVGIWFSIGLASPEGTSTLIHNFVFGWAIEWVFFIIELTAAAVYYYTWDKVPAKLHLKIGWLYAATSVLTLVIINGILSFMLTPGETWLAAAGTGQEPSKFWNGFFNQTYWPSLGLRMLVCLSLAGLWALVTASRIDGDLYPKLKTEVVRWSAKWLLPSFFLMPVFFIWYLYNVPEAQRQLLEFGVSTIGQGVFTQVTRAALVTVMTSATIVALVYLFAYSNPRQFTFGHACSILVLALAATASTEQAREMLRKPWVVGEHMYSNGIRVSQIEKYNKEGYLAKSPWLRAEERIAAGYSDVKIVPTANTPIDTATARLGVGELMFRGQCMSCHTVDGYRSMKRLLNGRDLKSIKSTISVLYKNEDTSPYRAYMPPVVGTQVEVDALTEYLDSLINPTAKTAGVAELAAAHP